jgi:hypothetical protein
MAGGGMLASAVNSGCLECLAWFGPADGAEAAGLNSMHGA